MRSIETPKTTPKKTKTPQTATKNHYRIYSQYHIMRKKSLGHSRPLRGGGGRGSWVQQWLFATLHTLILTSVDSDVPVQPPFKIRNSKFFWQEAKHSCNIQATCKGSDQTAHMRRLV